MSDDKARTTRLLRAVCEGEPQAAEQLFPVVYTELRRLAGQIVGRGPARPAGLQATELIHEAYLRLVDVDADRQREIDSRLHFKRLAAKAMRGVLVDQARAQQADKRGGAQQRVTLQEDLAALSQDSSAVLEVDEGLAALRAFDPQLAELVELRFFGQMTVPEVATALGVSESSVARSWRLARAWWVSEYGRSE